jgi:predicted DNA-binding transcriptional regulator AlpA
MHTSTIAMPQLFEQLGLESSNLAIARFIKHHHLPDDIKLQAATFWTKSQRQFISDSLQQDSDWSAIVDQLDALLRH